MVNSIGLYLAGYNLTEFEKIIYKYVLNDAMKYFRLFADRDKTERANENSKLEFYAAIHGIKVELNQKNRIANLSDAELNNEVEELFGSENAKWVIENGLYK